VKIRYSPCKWNPYSAHNFSPTTKPDTEIKVISDDILQIDGQEYEFSPLDVQWPDIHTQTDGVISEAHREDGELYITIRRFYTQSCSGWDTAQFHDVPIWTEPVPEEPQEPEEPVPEETEDSEDPVPEEPEEPTP